MCKFNPRNDSRRIDPCMKNLIENLKWIGLGASKEDKWGVVSCCCGHGKYPPSIIVESPHSVFLEIFSDTYLKRKKRFYKKDKQGYYYIPEVVENAK